MSAFVVSSQHINRIVNAIPARDLSYYQSFLNDLPTAGHPWTDSRARAALGGILDFQNIRSVCYRYSDLQADTARQHMAGESAYRYAPTAPQPPVAVLKLINSLEYQSCESPDWEQTRAYAVLERIRSDLIYKLPGYDEAPWAP